jgi:protein-S-isoprenylcysteine O-methyltransferase Ste14
MRRLPHPVPGVEEAPFAFRPHPSVARDLVARLEALPSRARGPRDQGRIEHLRNAAMHALDPQIPGLILLALTAVFVLVKRWTTGSFIKGRPEGSRLLWFTHVFNLFFLLVVNPSVSILLVARRFEALDPTVVHLGSLPLHLGVETGGLVLCLTGYSLMCWALVTMRGQFQVLGKIPRSSDRLFLSGPYKLIRHPMYSSVLCLSSGLALLTQSLALVAIFGVYVALILRLVPVEEEGLRRAYGEQFVAYQKWVKKLIPLVY